MKYKGWLALLLFIGCKHKEFINPNDPINYPSAPKIIYPMGDTLVYDNPPTFRWSSIDSRLYPSGGVYEIMCAEDSNFTTPLFSIAIDYTNYRPYELLGGRGFWKVRAKVMGASDKAWSEWSEVASFRERFPLVGRYDNLPGGIKTIIRDNYAYVMDKNAFHILNVSNPTHPILVTSFVDTGVYKFYSIEACENYLYFTSNISERRSIYSLRIYSISDHSYPQFVGECSLGYYYPPKEYIGVCYPAVYISQEYGDVKIINVSDPSHPSEVGRLPESPEYGFTVKGNYLILFGFYRTKVYDISDLLHPSIANSYDFHISKFCISGDTLVAHRDGRITLFDLSNLPLIKELGSFPVYMSYAEMCYSDNYLIIGGKTDIVVVELDGSEHLPMGKLNPSLRVSCIVGNKGYLYLMSYYEGVQIVKLCE